MATTKYRIVKEAQSLATFGYAYKIDGLQPVPPSPYELSPESPFDFIDIEVDPTAELLDKIRYQEVRWNGSAIVDNDPEHWIPRPEEEPE